MVYFKIRFSGYVTDLDLRKAHICGEVTEKADKRNFYGDISVFTAVVKEISKLERYYS
jgi:hypothetical protein